MSREFHKVLAQRKLVGYLAPTLEMPGVWSVYNLERKKIAMINPDGAEFQLMFYGRHNDESTEYFVARSFKNAVARAFRLEGLPAFDPPLDAPTEERPRGPDLEALAEGLLGGFLGGLPDDSTRARALEVLIARAQQRRAALG